MLLSRDTMMTARPANDWIIKTRNNTLEHHLTQRQSIVLIYKWKIIDIEKFLIYR